MSAVNGRSKIAIAGAGIAGAYLYRLLKNAGVTADVHDLKPQTRCGLTSCAWGSTRDFEDLVGAVGLRARDYVFRYLDYLVVEGLRIRAELLTFDKPRLIRDLLGSAQVRYSPVPLGQYDRVIDATGCSRAFLPPIEEDLVWECVQRLVETGKMLPYQIRMAPSGYAWCLPTSENAYHIGCGNLGQDPQAVLEEHNWFGGFPPAPHMKMICGCRGRIRLTTPHYSLPFVGDGLPEGIWGVGEAIGCVDPLAGEGVVPAMKSAWILLKKWHDPTGYTKAILKEFRWMRGIRHIVDKLVRMQSLGIREMALLQRRSAGMGLRVTPLNALGLWQRLRSHQKKTRQGAI